MTSDALLAPDFVCFTTRDYALRSGQSLPSASRSLNRFAQRGLITRVTKGVWANTQHPYFTPLACVPLLLGVEQGYVSFLTALHRHGAISQIPHTIQVATTGHSRRKRTPVGFFEFFQLKPEMMTDGIEWSEAKIPYRMATAEKALVDTLYLSTRKGRRFAQLPELEFEFDSKSVRALLNGQVKDKKIGAAIYKRLDTFVP